ncbi:MAG: hypothetical protein LQ346_001526 [Caloplaca aetnensis]|nr:MAG: hypothetical protein LQ346_001526 [Caloplaca aetnensis]
MYSMLRFLVLCGLWVSSALAAPPAVKETYVRCGTGNPAAELVATAQSMRLDPSAFAAAATLNVNVYFHVVTTAAKQGTVTQTQLNNQLAVLNQSYGPSGIGFTLISSDFTVNDQWATGNYDSTMKPRLRKGTYKDLNVYFLSDLGGGLLGICNFPANVSPGSSQYNQDGCDVLAQSVPGGTATNYNQGGTATHEIGHWFGLFHVFQGSSCSGSGDSVSDTPLQSTSTSGCPSSKDSCPSAAGLDSIHNYMDYSYDVCYTQFTPGQATRMKSMYSTYRAGK